MYKFVRNRLFSLSPETSHKFSLNTLNYANSLGMTKLLKPIPYDPVEVMGITFPNPIGLAAGLDKNGDYINALGNLGFGFIEVGTVTPLPQSGNRKPRLFRLIELEAIINRLGFNNYGVDHLVKQVKNVSFNGILGINIGKNYDTPNKEAINDYRICMHKVYQYADYISINISSPNTTGLRDLQHRDILFALLTGLKQTQTRLAHEYDKYVPLVVKISPDLSENSICDIAQVLRFTKMDGIIATNTTVARRDISFSPLSCEKGGLSGEPLKYKSTRIIKLFAKALDGELPVIGVGGILTGEDAKAKIDAGASLVQMYTGLIYKGPSLIRDAAFHCRTGDK